MPSFTTKIHGLKSQFLNTIVFLAVLTSPLISSATGINFVFNFTDAAGTGFNDAASGAARQNAMITAGNLFSNMFSTHFSNMGTVVLDATASDDPLGSTLASAGSEYVLGTGPGFNDQDVVRGILVDGVDLNGAAADGSVNVNFGQPWQLDPNATVLGTEFDFFAAVFHELTHALGFSSNIQKNGEDAYGNKTAGSWGFFDKFITDVNGDDMVDPTSFDINQAFWDTASIGGSSPSAGLFFDGANAKAANGGNSVGIFSPTIWNDGSSGSHLDTDNPVYSAMMMKHDRDYGSESRTYSGIEVGILLDLGYSAATSTPVPEPETYLLLLVGLMLIAKFQPRFAGIPTSSKF